MTTSRLPLLGLVAAVVAGCSASGGSIAAGGKGGTAGAGGIGGTTMSLDAPIMGTGGSSGAAGSTSASPDAASSGKGDALSSNLTDAPAFKWDACVGCSGGAVSGSGGAAGATGTGGSTAGAGGISGGGATGRGGSVGTGGSSGIQDAAVVMDAPRLSDASSPDAPITQDGGLIVRDAGPDVSVSPDTSPVADLRPADALSPDTATRCVAQIDSVIPVTDSLASFHLAAWANVQVVLRARVISGGPAATVIWSWQASRDGTPLTWIAGAQDSAAAAFPLAIAGNYSFTAYDKNGSACSATLQVSAVAANACKDCDGVALVRSAPPVSMDIPVQTGARPLSGSSPFSQSNVILARGVGVGIAPSVGSSLLRSYVRINAITGELTVDGVADPMVGEFNAQLLSVNSGGALLRYDVLVVPLDGPGGDTVAATAPQLFPSLTPGEINNPANVFNLANGVEVTGTTLTSTGQPVADVRVMLTNQDPATVQPSKLLFSSVGKSDATGSYLLHAQPGKYWVSLSPPPGSGLPEALAPNSVTLTGAATLGFKWDAVTTAPLTLNVLDAAGSTSAGTRVRLTSAQAKAVGTLTSSVASAQTANGNIQIESTTSSSGVTTFASLPDGASYDVLLVPATLGFNAATTETSLILPQGGGSQSVSLRAQGRINGQLVANSTSIDWSHVNVIAYDRSADTPEASLAVAADKSGSFSLPVSPGRPYVVVIDPDASSGLARTMVGPGPLQASEFVLTQKVQAAMTWSATVMDVTLTGLPGTAMQVFCSADWPSCIDPAIPLAETTSGDSGAFQLALPDPATR